MDGCSKKVCREPDVQRCGNGIKESGEECDKKDFGGATCGTEGYQEGGSLSCRNDCTIDYMKCEAGDFCGNGQLNWGEQCEVEYMEERGITCETLGYGSGTLKCDRCVYDTSKCSGIQTECGNGIIEAGEDCDGYIERKYTCNQFGFSGGSLGCTNECTFDISTCEEADDSVRAWNCKNGLKVIGAQADDPVSDKEWEDIALQACNAYNCGAWMNNCRVNNWK
jgi:hypothetical protein